MITFLRDPVRGVTLSCRLFCSRRLVFVRAHSPALSPSIKEGCGPSVLDTKLFFAPAHSRGFIAFFQYSLIIVFFRRLFCFFNLFVDIPPHPPSWSACSRGTIT